MGEGRRFPSNIAHSCVHPYKICVKASAYFNEFLKVV